MENSFFFDETLSITAYKHILKKASIRLHKWHRGIKTIPIRHQFMQREINLMRSCKRMITLIQSQLN